MIYTPNGINNLIVSLENTSETLLFRYYVLSPEEGFWFHKNGERNPDAPPMIPMTIIPERTGRGYMSCAISPEQQLLYCDEDWDKIHKGTFGIFRIHEKYTDEVSDSVATYRIARRDKALQIAEFDYASLVNLIRLRRDG